MDYSQNGTPIPERMRISQLKRPLRQNSNAVFFGLCSVFLLSTVLSYPLAEASRLLAEAFGAGSPELVSAFDMLFDIFISALMLLAPLSIIRLWVNIPPRAAFPMRPPRVSLLTPGVFVCLGTSAAGSLAFGVISAMLEHFWGLRLEFPKFAAPLGSAATALYCVRIILIPAVLEELLFRGVIMQSLRRFGDMFALTCSSVVFALAHNNAAQGVSAFCVAMAIGFFVLRTGSLVTGMLIHFVNNALAVAAEFFISGMSPESAGVFSALHFALYALLGFAGLIWLLLAHGGVFSLRKPSYPLSAGVKAKVFFVSSAAFVYYAIMALSLYLRG